MDIQEHIKTLKKDQEDHLQAARQDEELTRTIDERAKQHRGIVAYLDSLMARLQQKLHAEKKEEKES
jgi:ribosomal protein S15P/S13E